MVPILIAAEWLRPNLEQVAAKFSEVKLRFCAPGPEAVSSALTAEIAALVGESLPEPGANIVGLRWVHLLSAGYDFLRGRTLPKPDLILTNSSGGYTDGIAEFALMRMLMHAKKAEGIVEAQRERSWSRMQLQGRTLRGKRVVVVGNGSIGTETGRLCSAFGMSVAIAGRADADKLPGMVVDADYVVIAASLNPSSRGMINRALFERMQRRPYLVNVSRGAIVNTAELIDALRSGIVSGAALDVFEEEPLPADSPLYSTPGISISPHVSGVFEEVATNLAEVFRRNLECFLNGDPLPNRIQLPG
jgi:phosphoglycerate dehydrogenase-like enzyme